MDFLDYGLQQNTIFVFGLLSVLSLSVVVVLESIYIMTSSFYSGTLLPSIPIANAVSCFRNDKRVYLQPKV